MKKHLALTIAFVVVAALLTGCASIDVILKHSPSSLDQITEKYPAILSDNTEVDHYYYLSVDGETALKVSRDFSQTGAEDLVMQTPDRKSVV